MEVLLVETEEVQVRSDILVAGATVEVMVQGVSVDVDVEQDDVSLTADRPSS